MFSFVLTQRDETVTDDLQRQVVGYYEYLWFRKKGVTDDSLINAMPLTFHAEVSLSGNKYILDKVRKFIPKLLLFICPVSHKKYKSLLDSDRVGKVNEQTEMKTHL